MAEAIGTAYVEIGADTSKMQRELAGLHGKLENSLRGLDTKATALMGVVIGGMTAVTQMGIGKIIGMFHQMTSTIKESIIIASRVETLATVVNTIGRNAGYTTNEMESFITSVAKMGITTRESMQNIIRMAQAELDLTQASKLARVAQDAAVIANVNSSEAFSRMLHGIVTLQPEILRTLGIVVSFEQAFERYAEKVGKSVVQLSQSEKQQAAMNAVLEKGSLLFGIYEASMTTANKQILSMQRYTEELKLKIGSVFNEAFYTVVFSIVKAFGDMDKAIENLRKGEVFNEISNTLNRGIKIGIEFISYGLKMIWDYAKEWYNIFKGIVPLVQEIVVSVGFILVPIKTALGLTLDFINLVKLLGATVVAVGDLMLNWYNPSAYKKFYEVTHQIGLDLGNIAESVANRFKTMASDAEMLGERVAGITSEVPKTAVEKSTEKEMQEDLAIIAKRYYELLSIQESINKLHQDEKLSIAKKQEELKELEKRYRIISTLIDKMKSLWVAAGFDVDALNKKLKETEEKFKKGLGTEETQKTKSGIQELNKEITKQEIDERRRKEELERTKRQRTLASIEGQMAILRAQYDLEKTQITKNMEFRQLQMELEGVSEANIAKYVYEEKNRLAQKEFNERMKQIELEHQKEIANHKVATAMREKQQAAYMELEAKMYANEMEYETKILGLEKKKLDILLQYQEAMAPTAEATMELRMRKWRKQAEEWKRALPKGEAGKIDEEAYVKRMREMYDFRLYAAEREYEISKRMAELDIEERRGDISRGNVLRERISLNEELLKIYQKEFELNKDNADVQLNIRKKIDEVTRAIQEQRYQLEILNGTFSQGATQAFKDYYNSMKTEFEMGRELTSSVFSEMKGTISSVFKDLKNNELKDFLYYFEQFCNKILDKWLDMLAEMMTNWLITGRTMREANVGAGGIMSGGLVGGFINWLTGGSTGGHVGQGTSDDLWGQAFMQAVEPHKGGIIGYSSLPIKAVPMALFENAPRLHSGLKSDEFPAILQKGETVLPKNYQIGGMPDIKVEVYNNSGQPVSVNKGDAKVTPSEVIIPVVIDAITRNVSGIRDILRK